MSNRLPVPTAVRRLENLSSRRHHENHAAQKSFGRGGRGMTDITTIATYDSWTLTINGKSATKTVALHDEEIAERYKRIKGYGHTFQHFRLEPIGVDVVVLVINGKPWVTMAARDIAIEEHFEQLIRSLTFIED
jgi:hypothetical protein